jgi:acyl-CoA dehydrogenase
VRVPKDCVIGAVNRGWHNALLNFNRERCLVGAVQVGAAQACRDLAVRYAKERQQFGRPISAFQLVQSKLADMEVEVTTSRLLVYYCAWMVDQGIESANVSAIAKLFSGESYMRVAMNGMRVMAGWGYLMEYDMQRHYRDAKLGEIAPTSDIMRLVIAREILK